jgi:hypothetical protein
MRAGRRAGDQILAGPEVQVIRVAEDVGFERLQLVRIDGLHGRLRTDGMILASDVAGAVCTTPARAEPSVAPA